MDHVTATLLDCLVMRHTGLQASTTTPSLQPFRCKNEIIRQLAEAWRGIFSRIVERGWVLLWRYVPPQFWIPVFISVSYFHFTYTQFFITGRFDETTCFHCNIGLCDWCLSDDAWHEHVRWSPFCLYVYVIKGATFVWRSILRGTPIIWFLYVRPARSQRTH